MWDVAKAGGLDNLVIDAVHMPAFVDPAPADQVKWADTALAVMFEELEHLYRLRGDEPRASRYAALRAGATGGRT